MKKLFFPFGDQQKKKYFPFSKTLWLFPLALFIYSCGNKEPVKEYSDQSPGIAYKLIAIGDSSKKITEGDYVFLKAIYKTEKDSVFWDWKYYADRKYFIRASDKKLKSPLLGFLFSNYGVGDSLSLKVSKTIFFRELFDTIAPWFVAKDSFVNVQLQIEKILDQKGFDKYMIRDELKSESEKWGEGKLIADYVLTYFNFPEKADSLLYFERLNTTTDSLVRKGKTIVLSYRGTFMDSLVFDEVKAEKPTVINFGYEAQMLPGIEKVIAHLRKGENAKIIIPSQLGFGEQGSSNGSVPPNTTLLYEIKIIDVK